MKKILIFLLFTFTYLFSHEIFENYFLGMGLNHSSYSTEKKDITDSIVLEKLDDKSLEYDFEGGIYYKDFIASLNYSYVGLNKLDLNSLYFSLDYKFDYILKPYIGFSLGFIEGNWNKDLLVNSEKTKDKKMNSLLYGVQTGIIYPINKSLDFLTKISYQRFNLKTELISAPASSEILNNQKTSFGFKLRYKF